AAEHRLNAKTTLRQIDGWLEDAAARQLPEAVLHGLDAGHEARHQRRPAAWLALLWNRQRVVLVLGRVKTGVEVVDLAGAGIKVHHAQDAGKADVRPTAFDNLGERGRRRGIGGAAIFLKYLQPGMNSGVPRRANHNAATALGKWGWRC